MNSRPALAPRLVTRHYQDIITIRADSPNAQSHHADPISSFDARIQPPRWWWISGRVGVSAAGAHLARCRKFNACKEFLPHPDLYVQQRRRRWWPPPPRSFHARVAGYTPRSHLPPANAFICYLSANRFYALDFGIFQAWALMRLDRTLFFGRLWILFTATKLTRTKSLYDKP